MDSAGKMYVGFQNGDVSYVVQVTDSAESCRISSWRPVNSERSDSVMLRIDSEDNVHFSYRVRPSGYDYSTAYRLLNTAEDRLTTEVVPHRPGCVSDFSDLTIDADGKVHLFSRGRDQRSDPGRIEYATNKSGNWSWEYLTGEISSPNDTSADALCPSTETDARGHIYVAFLADAVPGNPSEYLGYYCVIECDGTRHGPRRLSPAVSRQGRKLENPTLAKRPNGGVYVVWEDDRTGTDAIYVNTIGASAGAPGPTFVGSVEDEPPYAPGEKRTPDAFTLYQNHPNPFNRGTVIQFVAPRPGRVRLVVYSVLGERVKTLLDRAQDPGYHAVRWDGRDAAGREAASGVYLCRLSVGEHEETKKLLMLR